MPAGRPADAARAVKISFMFTLSRSRFKAKMEVASETYRREPPIKIAEVASVCQPDSHDRHRTVDLDNNPDRSQASRRTTQS